jgi:hypothetical protein
MNFRLQPNNRLKLTARLFLAERPQFSSGALDVFLIRMETIGAHK